MEKTVKWIKDNIDDICQCGICGTLNDKFNEYCIDCGRHYSNFLDKTWDREQEVAILTETHTDEIILYI